MQTLLRLSPRSLLSAALVLTFLLLPRHSASAAPSPLPPNVTRLPVVFSGGHDTDPADRGRPVVLIAAALGVEPEIFRAAFRHVHPAGPGRSGPTDAEARQSKAALLAALGPYGVTDARLNEVSDFYRYPPGRGGLWKAVPATANALVKDGKVVGYEIIDGGAGYTTPPSVSVPGLAARTPPKLEITFGEDLTHNGTVSALLISQEKAN